MILDVTVIKDEVSQPQPIFNLFSSKRTLIFSCPAIFEKQEPFKLNSDIENQSQFSGDVPYGHYLITSFSVRPFCKSVQENLCIFDIGYWPAIKMNTPDDHPEDRMHKPSVETLEHYNPAVSALRHR